MANKCEFRELPDLNKARNRTQSFSFDYKGVTYPDSLVKYLKGKTYFIHTYGCQANIRDEESMRGMLEGVGFSKSENLLFIETSARDATNVQEAFTTLSQKRHRLKNIVRC